jgi:AcrR family transcriptional regulator
VNEHSFIFASVNINECARNTDKQDLVKETAISLLAKQGFEGFSMNKLAKACGISVATLYIYYADKDDLIKQIGLEMGREFLEAR